MADASRQLRAFVLVLAGAAALALPQLASAARVLVRADALPRGASLPSDPVNRQLAKIGYALAPASAIGSARPLPDPTVRAALVPNDPHFALGLRWALAVPRIQDAWTLTTGRPETLVAVLDSGVDAAVPDLAGALRPGYDFVNGDADPHDDNGHGTAVTSVLAARIDNGIGIAGVCGSCSVLPVKVLDADGNASASAVAAGIVWAADQGARVINLSLGSTFSSPAQASAVAYAQGKGALVVAAAGNSGVARPEYPAAYEGVVSVQATDAKDVLYPWSNHGPSVSLAAPGCATALEGGGAVEVCGTSIAAPIVAGAAALLLSHRPGLSGASARSLLYAHADRVSNSAHGRLNALVPLTAPAPPGASVQPGLSGDARVGGLLTATTGEWSGDGLLAFSFQWQRSSGWGFTDVPAATGPSYRPDLGDVGRLLRVVVTAVNAVGSASSASPATDPVPMPPPGAGAPPSVNGSARFGAVLTATSGEWGGLGPFGFSFQWQRGTAGVFADIPGAIDYVYQPGLLDVGRELRIVVTATNSGGATASASLAVTVAPSAPVNAGTPRIAGRAVVGARLHARAGAWRTLAGTATSFRYQWQRCTRAGRCVSITGATRPSLTVPRKLRGFRVRVRVTALGGGGSTVAYSRPTAPVRAR